MAGLHLLDGREHRLGAMIGATETKVVVDALWVRLPAYAGKFEQWRDLRREREPAPELCVVERLDPELVARERQHTPLAVDEREREHPDQPLESGRPPLRPGSEQYLGVRAGDEMAAERLKLGS